MRNNAIASMWTGLALTLVLCGSSRAQGPELGSKAPEINAKEWLNTFGSTPSLKNLRGQAVLIEFWATW
jgi:hypothetical protein